MIELSQFFTFEAAHFLPSAEDGNENRRLHGHSFRVEIIVAGKPDIRTGLFIHFDALRDICHLHVRDKLDHQFLNDIKGLENPTLENISMWIWDALIPYLECLTTVVIYRDTCSQKCVFRGYK